jgi:hypothetical protein
VSESNDSMRMTKSTDSNTYSCVPGTKEGEAKIGDQDAIRRLQVSVATYSDNVHYTSSIAASRRSDTSIFLLLS